MRLAALAALLVLGGPGFPGHSAIGEERAAVVVANRSAAGRSPLTHVAADAAAITELFRDLRFSVDSLADGSVSAMRSALSEAVRTPSDILVVYFSGYANVTDSDLFLLPTAEESPGLSVRDLISELSSSGSQLVLIVDFVPTGEAALALRSPDAGAIVAVMARRPELGPDATLTRQIVRLFDDPELELGVALVKAAENILLASKGEAAPYIDGNILDPTYLHLEPEAEVTASRFSACPYDFSERQRSVETLTCSCSAAAVRPDEVWGSSIYTDDSSVCGAAAHAGAVTLAGGDVVVRGARGCNLYRGSEANGVASKTNGRWRWSFFFPGHGRGSC